jgi:hypothetical protein
MGVVEVDRVWCLCTLGEGRHCVVPGVVMGRGMFGGLDIGYVHVRVENLVVRVMKTLDTIILVYGCIAVCRQCACGKN